jgi:hypothetical protein
MKKILAVQTLPNFGIKLTYDSGKVVELDFSSKILKGTVTEPLSDPEFFKRVRIARGGRALEWPGEVDFCADALWLEGSGEVNPFIESERAS